MTNYKKKCTICKKEFTTHIKNKNICSKQCRNKIKSKKIKDPKCMVCGWNFTIDRHYESGKEYILCPNHHSLLTRGKKTLEQIFEGTQYAEKIKESIISFSAIEEDSQNQKDFYNKLKYFEDKRFTYKVIEILTGWKYSRIKKYVIFLRKSGKIVGVPTARWKEKGGNGKRRSFRLV